MKAANVTHLTDLHTDRGADGEYSVTADIDTVLVSVHITNVTRLPATLTVKIPWGKVYHVAKLQKQGRAKSEQARPPRRGRRRIR